MLYLKKPLKLDSGNYAKWKKLKRISKLVIWGPWPSGGAWSSGAAEHLWPSSCACGGTVTQVPITLELGVPMQGGCQSLHFHFVSKLLCIICSEWVWLVGFDTDTTWDLQLQLFCVCLVNNTGQMEVLEKWILGQLKLSSDPPPSARRDFSENNIHSWINIFEVRNNE